MVDDAGRADIPGDGGDGGVGRHRPGQGPDQGLRAGQGEADHHPPRGPGLAQLQPQLGAPDAGPALRREVQRHDRQEDRPAPRHPAQGPLAGRPGQAADQDHRQAGQGVGAAQGVRGQALHGGRGQGGPGDLLLGGQPGGQADQEAAGHPLRPPGAPVGVAAAQAGRVARLRRRWRGRLRRVGRVRRRVPELRQPDRRPDPEPVLPGRDRAVLLGGPEPPEPGQAPRGRLRADPRARGGERRAGGGLPPDPGRDAVQRPDPLDRHRRHLGR